jgi:hypothetical protein
MKKKVGGSSSAHAKLRLTSNQTFSLTKFLLRIANNSFNTLIEIKDEKAKFLLRIANYSFNRLIETKDEKTKFLLRIANNSFNTLIEIKDEKAKFLLRIANNSFDEVNVFTQTAVSILKT